MAEKDQLRIEAQMQDVAVVRLWNALLPLKSVISFMNTGAHPDDETSSMLAALGRRDGIRLSHACSTRGEGGQNVIGTEAGPDIGMVRTREMERAAKVLDMTQYWHCEDPSDPIFDFGFSKSGKETLSKWGHERLLNRFVRILRMERPDIVCPTFLDIPGQHGHHRAMTQAAHEAVVMAAHPAVFPEHFAEGLSVWQVKKLYLPAWSGAGDAYDDDLPPPPETVRIDASDTDPVYGASYAQIGEWARVFHKTQGMGHWIGIGDDAVYPLHLAWTANGRNSVEDSITDELPQGLAELADWADVPEIARPLKKAARQIDKAFAAWPDRAKVGRAAVKALKLVRKALGICPLSARAEVQHRLEHKIAELSRVLCEAAGLSVYAEALAGEVAQGGSTEISVDVHAVAGAAVEDLRAVLVVPQGWSATAEGTTYTVQVPEDAALNDPYPDEYHPMRANGPVHVAVTFSYKGVEVAVTRDLARPLLVMPKLVVGLEPMAAIYNTAAPRPLETRISGAKALPRTAKGWGVEMGDNRISIRPPEAVENGLYCLPLEVDGQEAMQVRRANYAHVGAVARAEPAHFDVRVVSANLPEAKIAYINGGGDRAGYWMRALGLDVTDLDDAALAEEGRLAGFDTIVVGIFAFRTRPLLAAQTAALHDWVRSGGNLVTLYHRPWDNWLPDSTPPAFLEIGKPSLRWRVTDENAEVTYLLPKHPLLNTPNVIGPEDWVGWHKERGLYFAAKWDKAYEALLSMADPDEAALEGSLLSAEIGKGRHTHTSLILHHQMEKLVPGAFRLMANLVVPVPKK